LGAIGNAQTFIFCNYRTTSFLDRRLRWRGQRHSQPQPQPQCSLSVSGSLWQPHPSSSDFPVSNSSRPASWVNSIDQPRRTGQTDSNRHRQQQEQESNAESSASGDRPFDSQSFSGRPLWAAAADCITNPFGTQRRRWDDLSTPQTATATSSRSRTARVSGSPPNWTARFFSRRHRGTTWLVARSSAAKYSSDQSRRHRGATWLAAPNSGAKCSSVRSSSYLPAWTRTYCSFTHRSAGSAGTASRQPPPPMERPQCQGKKRYCHPSDWN
jgi:hypothetical protein